MTRQLNDTTTKMARHNTTTKAGKINILGSGLCEMIAKKILESIEKKHYFIAGGHYDLISEDGKRVEVKSTCVEKRFEKNYFDYNTSKQKYADLFYIFIDDKKLKEGQLLIRWKYDKKYSENIPLDRRELDLSDPMEYIEFKRVMKKKGIEVIEPEKEKITFCNCRNCGSSNFSMGENDRGEKIVFCSKCKEYYGSLERRKNE